MNDSPNLQSDRFPVIAKKQYGLLLALLKKTKRTIPTKIKKGLITKEDVVKFFEKTIKYAEDLEKSRLDHLRKLVNDFITIKAERDNVTVLDIVDVPSNNLELISVEEENDMQNATLIDDRNVILDTDIDNANGLMHKTTVVEFKSELFEENTCMDVDFEADNDNVADLRNQSMMVDIKAELAVTLEELDFQPLNEIDEDNDLNNQIETFTECTFDNMPESLESQTNKTSSNSSKYQNAIELCVDNNTPKNNSTKTPSMASSISSTKAGSGLYKSKYHSLLNSSQKAAASSKTLIKPQSGMKRTAEDVKRQKELIEEEKQRKLKEKLVQQDLRTQKLAQINKCRTNPVKAAVLLTKESSKMIPSSSKVVPPPTKDLSKIMPDSAAKDIFKMAPPMNKDATKMAPAYVKDLSKMPAKPIFTAPKAGPLSSKLAHASSSTVVHAPITKPVLIPINTCQTTPLAPPPSNNGSIFKTPVQTNTIPVLSESCRKIVVDHQSYNLDGLDSENSDDDENDVGQIVPSWANKNNGTLNRLSQFQTQHIDPSTIFARQPLSRAISIAEVFANYDYYVKPRASSAIWR